jgi:hypothetical protein
MISAPNGYFSPGTINTPLPTLERIRLPFKSYVCLHSLSSINELSKLEDLPFCPIYVSTKPNLIPPCVHRVLLVTLGFVRNPRRLGSPGGIRLVIRPVESLWGFWDHPKIYHEWLGSYFVEEAQGEEGEPSWRLGTLRGNSHLSNGD